MLYYQYLLTHPLLTALSITVFCFIMGLVLRSINWRLAAAGTFILGGFFALITALLYLGK